MENTLRELVTTQPWNNVRKYLQVYEEEFPEELGGNCVEQSEKLLKVLLDRGEAEDGDIIDLVDGKKFHAGLFVSKDGQFYYLDPGLLQLKPVNLSTLDIGQTSHVPALPILSGKHTDLSVTRMNAGVIRVSKTGIVGSRAFEEDFDLSMGRKKNKVMDPYGILGPSESLAFRFQLDNEEVRVRRSTSTGLVNCQRIPHSGRMIDLPQPSGYTLGWDSAFAKVEQKFNVSRREILRLLERGVEIHAEFNPR